MKKDKSNLPPGRPRAFDTGVALDRALDLFWRQGYEGTSLTDLTNAMGINRPSLYAAFGNKEELFRKALDRYEAQACGSMTEAMNEPTARAATERLLMRGVGSGCGEGPRGCLLVKGALACSEAAASVQDELNARRAGTETMLLERYKRAQQEGDLPADVNAADLARYIATVMQGISVQSVGGASRDQLIAVVDLAMRAFPG